MTNAKYDFSGKVALITGSSSGIGADTALQFARFGAKVTIHGRNVDALNQVAQKIQQETKHEPLKVVGDLLSDPTIPAKLVNETVAKYGRLDYLINNAGAASPKDSLDNEKLLEEYDKVFGLNVRCVIAITQLAMPHLEKTKGNIVNISSIASMRPYFPIYSAAKSAVNMFTQSSAQHLGPKGVRVNAICPGPVATGFGRSMGITNAEEIEAAQKSLRSMTLLDRVPGPEEITKLISFLVSDDAANITGSIIVSDTGSLVKKEMPNLN